MLYSVALAACWAGYGRAETVTWTIDSSQSWVRMSLPDQLIDIGDVSIFAGLRGAQPIFDVDGDPPNPDVVPWTDDRGARAPIGGTMTTEYVEGSSIQFNQANNNGAILETGKWIPNRNRWNTALNPDDFDYHRPQDPDPNGGFPAGFALELTLAGSLRVGHVTLYNIGLYADGNLTLSGTGPWTQSGGTLQTGGAAGSILDFWAQILTTSSRTVGNPSDPDIADQGSSIGPNSGGLTIENTGGQNRRMTINLNVPFTLYISGIQLVGTTYVGQIVANATLPSPAPTLVNARPLHNAYVGADKVDTGVSLIQRGAAPQQAQLTNIISSTQGINGVVLDFDNLAALGDITLEYKMSPQNVFATPVASWTDVPPAPTATLLPDAGQAGSDRVRLTWPNGTITDRYLCIRVIVGGNTIAELYLGHLRGEMTGASGGKFTVLVGDILAVRTDLTQAKTASGRTDVDKSGTVLVQDILDTRSNLAKELSQVTIPANP
ncbi:MAG TPA: hypothetical protein DCF63_07030 [Planctomycetaceae bacterium]|nr:hypothetical protein [Planctomycetaceae bacterium]